MNDKLKESPLYNSTEGQWMRCDEIEYKSYWKPGDFVNISGDLGAHDCGELKMSTQ